MAQIERYRPVIIVALFFTAQSCLPSTLLAAPTSVAKTQDLNFGKIAGGAGYAGSVTIGTSGVRSASGSIVLIGTASSPAQFTITGNAGKAYSLTVPAGFIISSGEDQMNVSAVTSSIPATGTIPANGVLPFTVGGTLTLSSSQRSSTYSGSLVISVR